MAAGRNIKGITIEIDGDTKKLQNAIKDANRQIRDTQAQLKDVDKLLKFDPGNTELLAQKQKLLGQVVDETKSKLDILKQTNEEVSKTAANYDAWREKYDPIKAKIGETEDKLEGLKKKAKEADEQLAEGKISQEKYDALQSEIKETEDSLKNLKDEAKAVDDEFGKPIAPEQYDALQREIIETEQDLKSLETEYKNFGSVAAQQIAVAGDKMKELGGKIEGAGRAIMPISTAVAGVGTVATAKFAEVDKIMALTNQTMRNTEEEAQLLQKAMEDAAANSTFGMNDAANASLNFARAGLDAKQAAATLAPAMNLAAGEGGNLDTVSQGLVATINGFGDSFDNAGRYADVFASACNNSALDIDSLSGAMSIAAPIFKSAGYSVNDAALYMGIMANNGIDANVAANALKTGIARLASPATEGAEAMERLGIEVFNADGSMKDSVEVQKLLHDSFATLSEQEQIAAASAIFGKNQMSNWLALINTAPGDVQTLSNSLAYCEGTTEEMADAMMSGFGGSIEKLKSSVDVLMTSLGGLIAECILPLIEKIQSAVDWLNGLDDGTKKIIVGVGLFVAAIGPCLIIVGKMTTAIGSIMTLAPKIVGAFGSIGGAIGKIGGSAGTAASSIGQLGGAAGSAAAPAASAGEAIGTLSQNALGFIALGAGILLAAAGLALMAKAAIELGKAGAPAAIAMGAMVAVLALLAVGAAALGPALTAGAVGLVAFGAAVALVGVGVLAVSAGLSLLAGHLPTIAEYGGSAAEAIAQLGIALIAFAAGATTAGAGAAVLGVGLVGAAAGATAVTVAAIALAGGLGVLTVAVLSITVAIIAMAAGVGILSVAIIGLGVAVSTAIGLVIGSFDQAESSATNTLKSIKNTFTTTFNNIKSFMTGIIDWLKGIFSFEWNLPKIKLPHFNISGNFSLNPPSVPSFGIEWYQKAMADGMILNSPTIFGMAGGHLLGGGEAGAEMVAGVDSVRNMITEAVVVAMESNGGGNIVIPVYVGQEHIDDLVVNSKQRTDYRSGGH